MFNVAIASRLLRSTYYLFFFSLYLLETSAGREGSGVRGRILLCFRRIWAFFGSLAVPSLDRHIKQLDMQTGVSVVEPL
jgi:hypothetical protein